MNKEQTHKEINRLICFYEKRIDVCSNQWDELNEDDIQDPERDQLTGESMNGLISEMDLMEEFIDDLKRLLNDKED